MSRETENKKEKTEQNEAAETEKFSADETAKPACGCCGGRKEKK